MFAKLYTLNSLNIPAGVMSMIALGLDIVRGNPLSRTSPPLYAVVVLDSKGRVIHEAPEASLNTIIRLIWEFSVNRVGVDNIYELAPTSRDVAKILTLFPSYTEVYQVTLEDDMFVDLATQASKVGINLISKPRPLQTAYICAVLALNGIGTPIRALERKTKIIVSRARSMGPGGSSSTRYVRGMRTAILRVVKEVRSLLESAKLDYDIIIRKSSGGLDSAIFTVYADSETVRRIVKPYKGNDVRVVIKPVYTSIMIAHSGAEPKKRPLIIGIDPGIETGLAVIDLSLNLLLVESSKELDRLDIIDRIYQYGIPVLIAVDTNPPPENARKLASMLGTPLYVPSETLDSETKDRLIEWFKKRTHTSIKISTTHERDALASAVKAYKAYEKKLIELERKLLEMDIDVDLDEMKSLIFKGYSISNVLEYAINMYLSTIFESSYLNQNYEHARGVSNCNDYINNLEAKIRELTKENEILRNRLREVEHRIEMMLFERRFENTENVDIELIKNRMLNHFNEQIRQLQNVIDNLRKEIDMLNNKKKSYIELLTMIMSRKVLVVPRLKSVSAQDLHYLSNHLTPNKIIVVDGEYIPYELLNQLKQMKLLPIFSKCSPEIEQQLINEEIPVICGINISILDDDFAVVNVEDLDNALVNAISKLLTRKRKLKTYLTYDDIIRIISEYRESLQNNA
uniref:DUF460 domain-containing protein n=1 Tax=Ignisphaera aggregans TaxID=334771 RepID=A0A7C2VG32_9CREN